jgi:hypothetical protein
MKTRMTRIAAVASICALSGVGFVLAGSSAQAASSHERASVTKSDERVHGGKSKSAESKSNHREDSVKSKTSSKKCHDDNDNDDDAPVAAPVVVG